MEEFNYWKNIIRSNRYPCYVHDVENNAVLYANPELYKTFGLKEDVTGKAYYHLIDFDVVSQNHKMPINWQANQSVEVDFCHKVTQKKYRAHAFLLRGNQRVFCQFEPLDGEETQNSFETAMNQCLDVFQQPPETMLASFLEIMGRHYKSERAFIYKINRAEGLITLELQWARQEMQQIAEGVSNPVDFSALGQWLSKKEDMGVITSENLEKIPQFVHWFQNSGIDIQNFSFGILEDENKEMMGMVGISNFETPPVDHRLMRTVMKFVSDSLREERKGTDASFLDRDMLTGIYNRVGFTKYLEEIQASPPKSLGVLSINVNGLKIINSTMGTNQGDKHIVSATQQLQNHFQGSFFRLSGDEFMGLLPDIEEKDFESQVLSLHKQMKRDHNYDFSMGHAWGSGRFDFSKLQLEAETTMYINKQEYYSSQKRVSTSVNDSLLADLLSSLAEEEFMIYLQPQINLKDDSLYGAEALVRCFSKKKQAMVFPDQFIPLYEQNSIIRHIDIFVVETVCKLLASWGEVALPISVNLSRVTLQEFGIVDTIVDICKKYHVPHNLLVIEVTERVGLIENNVASALITEFVNQGFSISLDDFGCAYSNIITLAQIDVDEVKIDKSLIDDLTTNRKNQVLVKNILEMCDELGDMHTLSEGIEDEAQAKILKDLGCDLAQGYFYSRPMSVDDFQNNYILRNEA